MRGTTAPSLARIVVLHGLLLTSTTEAHHSAAVFDAEKEIELRGVVVDFKLRSPHSSFVVDARVFSKDGAPLDDHVARWEIESESVPVLRSYGVDASTFEAGDPITIRAAPHRDPSFRFAHSLAIVDAFGVEYVMANSNRLFSPSLRERAGDTPRPVVAPASADGIARLRGKWQQPLTRFAADGPGLPLNDAGLSAWRGYDPKRSPANSCEPINVPDLFFSAFFLLEIRIDERSAVLHNEYYDVVRNVPLGGRPALADSGGRFGNVLGKIDGDVLVVESRNFRASRWGLGVEEAHGADIPSSERKTLTERFTASADGRTLVYEYTLDDPTYMTSSKNGRVELARVPDITPFYPFECDTESASMWSRQRGDPPLRIAPAP
jgi:Family of unknown function (DUF6152)